MKFFLVGNWKMNGGSALLDELSSFLGSDSLTSPNITTIICPPSVYVSKVSTMVSDSGVLVGGQDCHASASGSHTGDISAEMLRDCGCHYCIVGHSERRQNHNESDSLVQSKSLGCIRSGLTPIVCVGESESDYDSGATNNVLEAQLSGSLPLSSDMAGDLFVAYEPVWAIGTGKVADAETIGKVHSFIREFLVSRYGSDVGSLVPILYGGSVKGDNAGEISSITDVNGLLVGGASLTCSDFLGVYSAIKN